MQWATECNSQELALADGLAGQLLAGLLVYGKAGGAELAPAQHFAEGVEAVDIL